VNGSGCCSCIAPDLGGDDDGSSHKSSGDDGLKGIIVAAGSIVLGMAFVVPGQMVLDHPSDIEDEATARYQREEGERPQVRPQASAPSLHPLGRAFQIPLLSFRF
jgi:hypothetical protein